MGGQTIKVRIEYHCEGCGAAQILEERVPADLAWAAWSTSCSECRFRMCFRLQHKERSPEVLKKAQRRALGRGGVV